MKVIKKYNIDVATLSDLSQDSSYWETAYDFFMDVKNKEDTELTDGQRQWLEKIEKSLK